MSIFLWIEWKIKNSLSKSGILKKMIQISPKLISLIFMRTFYNDGRFFIDAVQVN